jgi:hypothetical protein
VALDGGLSCNITAVSGELFPVGVLIARVKAEIEVPLEGDTWDDRLFDQLSSLRNPHTLGPINSIFRRIIALTKADRAARLGDIQYEHFFAMKVTLPVDRRELTAFVTERSRALVALLIGTRDPSTLDAGVIDKVVERNAEVNAKSTVERLILNRQGMLYFLPIGKYAGPHPSRFERVTALAMLGAYSKSFLTDAGRVASYWPSYVHLVGGKLGVWIESPNLVFRSSVSNELVWRALAGALELSAHLKGWSRGLPRVQSPEELTAKLRAVSSEWWKDSDLPRVLEQGSITDPLKFVTDPNLREFIRQDRDEACRCLSTGNYRAAVVMIGASVEGILLELLFQNRGESERDRLKKMGMAELIEECCPGFRSNFSRGDAGSLIKAETAIHIYRTVRAWRNYVHPGVNLRADSVDQAEANAAMSALELLLKEVR